MHKETSVAVHQLIMALLNVSPQTPTDGQLLKSWVCQHHYILENFTAFILCVPRALKPLQENSQQLYRLKELRSSLQVCTKRNPSSSSLHLSACSIFPSSVVFFAQKSTRSLPLTLIREAALRQGKSYPLQHYSNQVRRLQVQTWKALTATGCSAHHSTQSVSAAFF